MELQLRNIGMIEEANVKIDGLTVIAGENDTGKSTVGKALCLIVKSLVSDERIANIYVELDKDYKTINKPGEMYSGFSKDGIEKIFGINFFSSETYLNLVENNKSFPLLHDGQIRSSLVGKDFRVKEIVFVESPIAWNFTDFFRDISQIESQFRLELNYPYLMKDLNFKLHIKSASDGLDIKERVTNLMGGEFKKDEMGRYYFDKNGQKIELVNTATGIKSFGIFQVLSQNNWLNKDTVLVLDEPEVHLHPKWQLEMAKVIVELVKNGVKVLVNSHSPYMIEALKRYSELEGQENKTNFYLAEDGYIKQIEDSNSKTLVEIYEKLSEPYDTFEEMDSQRMEKLING